MLRLTSTIIGPQLLGSRRKRLGWFLSHGLTWAPASEVRSHQIDHRLSHFSYRFSSHARCSRCQVQQFAQAAISVVHSALLWPDPSRKSAPVLPDPRSWSSTGCPGMISTVSPLVPSLPSCAPLPPSSQPRNTSLNHMGDCSSNISGCAKK